jgi:hypothetical protein
MYLHGRIDPLECVMRITLLISNFKENRAIQPFIHALLPLIDKKSYYFLATLFQLQWQT